MSNIGLMEGAYFVGRKEIMEWVNNTCGLNLSKVEETANGAVSCMLLDIMYPGQVPMHKVNWGAKQNFEFVSNYKILQTAFTKLRIDRHIDVDRLMSARAMDNLEFMQWFKR
jgi:microtubule-associated protein, RP/EB family